MELEEINNKEDNKEKANQSFEEKRQQYEEEEKEEIKREINMTNKKVFKEDSMNPVKPILD